MSSVALNSILIFSPKEASDVLTVNCVKSGPAVSIFLSVVTVPVPLVTGVPALLALSLYAMLKLTAPRVSLASAV